MQTVNTAEYWEKRFKTSDWSAQHGEEQSVYFARLAITGLKLVGFPFDAVTSFLDFGCATGDGIREFVEIFNNCVAVYGVDISASALYAAKKKCPQGNFTIDLNESSKVDVIFSSNTLEHFSDPFVQLERLLNRSNRYCVLLLPYEEPYPISPDHEFRFSEDSFPKRLNGFVLTTLLKMLAPDPLWAAWQVLVIYERCDKDAEVEKLLAVDIDRSGLFKIYPDRSEDVMLALSKQVMFQILERQSFMNRIEQLKISFQFKLGCKIVFTLRKMGLQFLIERLSKKWSIWDEMN